MLEATESTPKTISPIGMHTPLKLSAVTPIAEGKITHVALQPFGLFVRLQGGDTYEQPLPLSRPVTLADVEPVDSEVAKALWLPSSPTRWMEGEVFATGPLPALIVEDHARRMNPGAQSAYIQFLEAHLHSLTGGDFSPQRAYEAAVRYAFAQAQGENPLIVLPLLDEMGMLGIERGDAAWAQSQIATYAQHDLAQLITPANGMSEQSRMQSSSLFDHIIADTVRYRATQQYLSQRAGENVYAEGPSRKVFLAGQFYADRVNGNLIKLETRYKHGDLWSVGTKRAYGGLDQYCQQVLKIPSPFRLA